MIVAWLASLRLRDVSIVDVAWGLAFTAAALASTLSGAGDADRRVLLVALTAIWGSRLSVHLARRKLRTPGEDRRYRAMRTRYGERFPVVSLYLVFAVQWLLITIVSLPVTVGASNMDQLGPIAALGCVVWLLGFTFEAVSDYQLARFTAVPDTQDQVMDRGLWRYTRHPNYFGDACVWWGIWLVGGSWWTAVGPLLMSVLLVRLSGKDLLERDIAERRPGYRDYVARTPGFLPGRPRDG
jgi:steroid 5-alpha reductase family enzyme